MERYFNLTCLRKLRSADELISVGLAKVLGVADDKVDWNNENKIAAMKKDSTVIEAWDSGNQIVVNQSAKYIYNNDKNGKAFLSSDGFTYLPLHAFAENLPNVKIQFVRIL